MKKILSFILTGAMLLSALPATFFASAGADVHDHDHDVATIAEGKCPGTGKPHSKEILGNDESKYTFVEHIDGDPHDCTVAEYTVYQCNECKDYFADDYSARVSHSFKEIPGTAKAPTCKTEGKKADLQCEICGYVQTGKKLDKTKDHKWKVIPGKTDSEGWMDNPNTGNVCTQGRRMRECEICGEIQYENDGHDWQFKSVKTEPTHGGADGVAIYECTTCHETKEVAIKATPHTWASSNEDGWELSKEGDCTTPDTLKRECTICGLTEEKQGDVRHNWGDHTITVEPTCFTFGYTTRFCDVCGRVEQTDVQPKLEHEGKPTTEADKKARNYVESTCEAPESWTCTKGDDHTVTGAPKLGHDVETVRLPAYCGRKSLTFSYCKRDAKLCKSGTTTIEAEILNNSKINTNIGNTDAKLFQAKDFEEWKGVRVIKGSAKFEGDYNASNHLWDTAYIEVEATCEHSGKEVVYCRFCSQYLTQTVDKLPHTWEKEQDGTTKSQSIPATCQQDGSLEYFCATCRKWIVQETYPKDKVIKDTYSSYDEAKAVHKNLSTEKDEIRPATCEVLGLSKAHCPDCEKDILFTIKKDHTNDGVFDANQGEKERVEATCTTDGSEAKFVCVDCGKLVGGEKIPAFGHNYTERGKKVEPTCTTDGKTEWYVCENCGEADPNRDGHTLPKLGHDYKKVEDKKDPTCTEDGHAEKWVCARPNCPGENSIKPAVDPNPDRDGHKINKTDHKWGYNQYFNYTDCTAPQMIILRYCTNPNCDVEYVANEDYTAAKYKTHKFEDLSKLFDLTPKCEEQSHTRWCENPGCIAHEELVIPGTGHHNKYNELILEDCKDKEAAEKQAEKEDGRKCVDCDKGEIPVPYHDFKYSTTIEPTCVDDGGKVYICSVCHASEVREKEEATGHSWKNNPDIGWETVTEPTYASKGQEKRVCGNGCGTVEYRDMPALGTGHADPKDDYAGLQITLSADNADVPGAGYTDSSLIAVKVSLASYLGVDVWGVSFKVNYDADYMEFVSGKIVSTTFLSNQRVTAVTTTVDEKVVPAGYVNVNANVPATQNTKVQASEDFAILYFRVKDTTRDARLEAFDTPNRDLTVSTDFNVEVVRVINNNSVNITTGVTNAEVVVRPFLDWNCDGSIDIADLLDLTKMITWESEVIYDVSFDVNKNGEIDIDDMMTLLDVISETISYAQAYAQAAQ